MSKTSKLTPNISPGNISPSDDPGLADEVLRAVHNVCQKRGILWFIYAGTLLGLYRDGTWTEDNDVDVVLLCSEEDYQSIWSELAHLPDWTDSSGLRKGEIQLDLKHISPDPPYTPPSWKPHPFSCTEFEVLEYEGMEILAPCPIEGYLEWAFTENWRIPMSREAWRPIVDWMQRRVYGERKSF